MANISGTAFNDFIHRAGDGAPGGPSGGGQEFATATTGADVIDAGAGSDLIYSDAGADSVTAGTGADFISAGAGSDTVDAGDDNDTIVGGQNADRLLGGVGNDVFQIQQVSDISGLAETIDGGSDIDRLDFAQLGAFGPINLSLAVVSNVETLQLAGNDITMTAAQMTGFDTFLGGGAIDRLIMSAAGTADFTDAAFNSIEEIRGSGGNDTITLTGVTTGQTVNGVNGNDRLTGGSGNDLFNGGLGVDTLFGGGGNDTLLGSSDRDAAAGDDGNDVFRMQFVSDISGLAETLRGGLDFDTLDFLTLGAGGAVNLTLSSISSVEAISVAGNDVTLTGAQLGAFTNFVGLGSIDRFILSAAGAADLTDAVISGIDEFRGSSGNDNLNFTDVANGQFIDGRGGVDTIRGSDGGDTIFGGDGGDALVAYEGDDTILGGQGADSMSGGVGYDDFRIDQVSDISGLAETVNGGSDVDTLNFQTLGASGAADLSTVTFAGVETVLFFGNSLTFTAAQLGGFDRLSGLGGFDRVQLAAAATADLAGADIFGIDEFRGTSGADGFTLTGVAFGQTVNGLDGNDTLTGGDGADRLDGGLANDRLIGDGGLDTIVGGLGADSMTGGAGVDTFLYQDLLDSRTGANRDVISDFLHGTDVVNLQAADANSEAAGDQNFIFIGGAAFGGVAGQLRYSGGVLFGDADGDGVGEFQIVFSGAPGITAADIVL